MHRESRSVYHAQRQAGGAALPTRGRGLAAGFFRLRTGVREHLFLAKGGHAKVELEVVFLDVDRDAGR